MNSAFLKDSSIKVPVKKEFIPLARPDIRDEDIALVNEVLRSGMLVQGEYVLKLEEAFANYHKVKNAIAVSNGTATLHLCLKALGIGRGDEVILPAFSYIATANVIELVEATPVFIDIDDKTFNIDTSLIEKKITDKTKAIIPVHEFGLACDIAKVCAIAARYNIPVIEDAACALGAKQNDRLVGTYGIGSFSLHPRKSITSGEGGVILTNDDSLAGKLRQLRNHGISMEHGEMDFVEAGFNYRMTDFQAALAYSQFQRLNAILEWKHHLADLYFSSIGNAKIHLPFIPPGRYHTWQTFHLLLDDSLNQKKIIELLKKEGIGTNYGAQCIPAQTYYFNKYRLETGKLFPNALIAYKQGLAIPMYERLTEEHIKHIAKTINTLC